MALEVVEDAQLRRDVGRDVALAPSRDGVQRALVQRVDQRDRERAVAARVVAEWKRCILFGDAAIEALYDIARGRVEQRLVGDGEAADSAQVGAERVEIDEAELDQVGAELAAVEHLRPQRRLELGEADHGVA